MKLLGARVAGYDKPTSVYPDKDLLYMILPCYQQYLVNGSKY